MSFNYNKLKSKTIEKYGTQREFAKAFGITNIALSRKLNNQSRFSTDDIIVIVDMLDIPENEITEYFFTRIV